MTSSPITEENDDIYGLSNEHQNESEDVTKISVTEKNSRRPLLRQAIGSVGAIIIALSCGMVLGYSAILLPQLSDESSTIKISKDEESWIASLAPLQMGVGCLIVGWAMDMFGRKLINILSAFLLIVGWILVYFARSITLILIGRIVSGIAVGIACPVGACYVAEVCEPKLRGIFLIGIQVGISFGIFFVHLLGTYLSWKIVALISAFIPIISIMSFIMVQESHVWFIKVGRLAEAKRTFSWYRGDKHEANLELEAEINHAQKVQTNDINSYKQIWKDVCKPQFYKPFLICTFFFIIMQLSGNNAVTFYSVTIMQSTIPTLDEYSATLFVDIIRLLNSIIACFLTKKYNVRPLTFFSGFGGAIALFFLAISAHFLVQYSDNQHMANTTLLLFLLYTSLINVGLVPMPWLVIGEILPTESKGLGSGIAACINFLTIFVVVKTTPDMFENVGVSWTYVFYGGFCLFGTIVLYFILPETKNRTLQDIQEGFIKKKHKNIELE